jgi:hypothetical protein
MVEKLTVILIIFLFLLVGTYLILSPWNIFTGINVWEQNYFLVLISQKTGMPFLQQAVASNWFRGAITGLGVLNIVIAFWEMAHFNQSVEMLRGTDQRAEPAKQQPLDRLNRDLR